VIDRAGVTVLIADDHPLFRLGLGMALRSLGFGRVDEAVDGHHAVELCRGRAYRVVMLDLRMPRLNGIEAAQGILGLERSGGGDPPVVIMLTTFDEPAIVRAAQQAGVGAFMSKETEPEALARAIDRLLTGERTLPTPRVTVPELSGREHDVLRHLASGASVKGVADVLGISPETVKDHVSNVYAKLGVRDRVSAVREARVLGLLLLDEIAGADALE